MKQKSRRFTHCGDTPNEIVPKQGREEGRGLGLQDGSEDDASEQREHQDAAGRRERNALHPSVRAMQTGVRFARSEHDDAGGGESETDDQPPEEGETGRAGEHDGDRTTQDEARAGDYRRAADDAGAVHCFHTAQTVHTDTAPRRPGTAVAT
jgi:hypothetical protein